MKKSILLSGLILLLTSGFQTLKAQLTVSGSSTMVTCNGMANGSATGTATGGTPPFSYTWSPAPGGGQGTLTATGLAPGIYTLTVHDMLSSTGTYTATITEPPALTTAPTSVKINCGGQSTGIAIANPSGGTTPYSYSWIQSTGYTDSLTNLAAGTYSCLVQDMNGCSTTPTVTVTENTPLSTSASTVSPNCFGGNNGSATVTAFGGSGSYTYSWNVIGCTSSTPTGLTAGNYTCFTTDSLGCSNMLNVTISDHNQLFNSGESPTHNVSCFGGSDGIAWTSPVGGTGPYTYSWTAPASGSSASCPNLPAGTYTCLITDSLGCTVAVNPAIQQPAAPITITMATMSSATCGQAYGSANATVNGGTTPYNYSWNPTGQTNAFLGSVGAGIYTVTVTDANGCILTDTAHVTNANAPIVTATSTNVSCYGGANGTATATPTGGITPYTYSWNNAATSVTANITGQIAANLTVFVTGSNGCVGSQAVTITQPDSLSGSITSTNPVCASGTGTAVLNASGGTKPWTFSWSPTGGTTPSASGLVSGTYTCNLVDANGCTLTQTTTIYTPSAIVITPSQTSNLCFGYVGASATVSVTGGVMSYSYSWSNGQTSSTASNLASGTYTCTVTDMGGCTASQNFTIVDPPNLNVVTTSHNISCNGLCDGIISVSATGGTGAYTYSWDNGATSVTLASMCKGIHQCTVFDGNGCQNWDTSGVIEPPPIAVNVSGSTSSCGGACDGSLSATVTGGTGAYTYSWTPAGPSGALTSQVCAGTYTCAINDANGCSTSGNYTVGSFPSPAITGTVIDSVSGNVSAGWTYLVSYDTVLHRQLVVDSAAISAGRYHFNSSTGGNFLVYAIADHATYPGAIKTYYANTDQWVNATVLNAGCATADTANIKLIDLTPTSGSGTMSGAVYQSQGFVARYAAGTVSPIVLAPGDPVPGLDVNLEQHPGGIIAQHTTAGDGTYTFSNLPHGTFEVFVDIPGLGMTSEYVRTITTNQSYPNLDYKVDSMHIRPDSSVITGMIPAPAVYSNSIHVSPNPFRDQVKVTYSLSEPSEILIQVYNMLGEEVSSSLLPRQEAGTYSYQLNTSDHDMGEGVYMMKVTMGRTSFTQRVVRVR